MFESRKTTQCGQKEIIWDSRAVFLLSLLDKEEAGSWEEIIEEDTVLIRFRYGVKKKEPCFGPQDYLDAKAGAGYLVQVPIKEKYIVIYQHKDWWVRPGFFEKMEDMPKRSQLFIGKEGEDYFVLLAVCGETCRSDMQGCKDGILVTMASNGGNRQQMEDVSLVIAAGKNPYECCERAAERALSHMGKPEMLRSRRRYPELFEKFGWCSWDAFYHEGILEKMEEFSRKKIPLGWVLIDDGWLDADYHELLLRGLDAEKKRFPKGLAACVNDIKEKYGIAHVGVWHAVMGYWNGLEKNSEAENEYGKELYRLPDGRILPAADAGRAFGFYDKWHTYLKNKCGIDFVKVDGQSTISLAYGGMKTYGEASREIQKGLNASAALHFQNSIINCMGMASEDMWNRPSSAISRSSDDFVPKEPHGFSEHALQNSYNSLLQGQFFWGDWDMFWSSHGESRQNSMLRAVSGGPVYVSDGVEKTDMSSVFPLIHKDGTILRCEGVGMPTLDCLFENPLCGRRPLKIFNRYRDRYLITAFHLYRKEECCEGEIRISDIPDAEEEEYLVYAWTEGKVFLLSKEQPVLISLFPRGCELYFMTPKKERCQLLGILEKYLPCACIGNCWKQEEKWIVSVTESGTFGLVSQQKPRLAAVNGKAQEVKEKENGLYLVTCAGAEEYLLEIIW